MHPFFNPSQLARQVATQFTYPKGTEGLSWRQ